MSEQDSRRVAGTVPWAFSILKYKQMVICISYCIWNRVWVTKMCFSVNIDGGRSYCFEYNFPIDCRRLTYYKYIVLHEYSIFVMTTTSFIDTNFVIISFILFCFMLTNDSWLIHIDFQVMLFRCLFDAPDKHIERMAWCVKVGKKQKLNNEWKPDTIKSTNNRLRWMTNVCYGQKCAMHIENFAITTPLLSIATQKSVKYLFQQTHQIFLEVSSSITCVSFDQNIYLSFQWVTFVQRKTEWHLCPGTKYYTVHPQ